MIYASIYGQFGIAGLVAFALAFAFLLYGAVASVFYFYYFRRHRAYYMPSYRPDPAELRHALRWSVYGIVGNAILLLPIQLLIVHGYSRIYHEPDAFGWGWLALSLPAALLFSETCIYWIHRGLHTRRLYGWLHRYHHHYREPTPLVSFSFHPVDSFAQSLPYHIFAFLVPTQEYLYFGLIFFAAIWTLLIHNRVVWVPPSLVNNTGCHMAHHWYYRYNYGNYFTLWDRLAGTYFDPAGLPERFYASKYGWRRQLAAATLTGAGSTPSAPAP